MKSKIVLFLCTGNYYRSRFAEILFNSLATTMCPDYLAESRGLAEDLSNNSGPISAHALDGLEARRILSPAMLRYPLPLAPAELQEATCIIALYEREHRPLLQRRFPGWADRIEYWQVPDLDGATSAEALDLIEQHVRKLIDRLCEADTLDISGR